MNLRDAPPVSLDEALRQDALERQQITDTPRDEVFDRIVRSACAALEAPVGAITFIESERQWIKSEQGLGLTEMAREISFCTHALLSDDVMAVEDASRDPRFASNPQVTEQGVRFYAGAPLIMPAGYRLGTLCVADHIARRIGQRDRDLLRDMAAIVVGELELRRRAGTDPVTGLYTRRFFQEVSGRELIRARRANKPLSAALVHADHVKRINDTLGPAAGDAVLRVMGPVASRAMRESDLLGRWGDEELVLLLPGVDLRKVAPVLQRLRQGIAELILPELQGAQITVSIGAAELLPEDLTIGAVLARADGALYRAKHRGRNRLELAA